MSTRWTVGEELPVRSRVMTAERMRWYADALETCSADDQHPVIAPPNIHTDDDVARENGLPARVSDGMVSTNWISTALAETFGDGYLRHGSLKTRYVRPILEDERIRLSLRVVEVQPCGDGQQRLTLEVSCLKDDDQVATGGTATVVLPVAGTSPE